MPPGPGNRAIDIDACGRARGSRSMPRGPDLGPMLPYMLPLSASCIHIYTILCARYLRDTQMPLAIPDLEMFVWGRATHGALPYRSSYRAPSTRCTADPVFLCTMCGTGLGHGRPSHRRRHHASQLAHRHPRVRLLAALAAPGAGAGDQRAAHAPVRGARAHDRSRAACRPGPHMAHCHNLIRPFFGCVGVDTDTTRASRGQCRATALNDARPALRRGCTDHPRAQRHTCALVARPRRQQRLRRRGRHSPNVNAASMRAKEDSARAVSLSTQCR